ncbi:DDE transposase, partial [Paenibacillus residui]
NTERGTNAVQLSSFLQVTYKTAWAILHKIRQALSQADHKQPLTGVVKGGTAFHRPFRSAASVLGLYPEQRPVFVVASLGNGTVPQQVKIKTVRPEDMEDGRIYRSAGEHFIKEHVSPDAIDVDIETRRYHYQRVPSLRNYLRKARAWTNRVFNGIGPKYLQHYLDEFCFRLNKQLQNVPIFEHLARACIRLSMERP